MARTHGPDLRYLLIADSAGTLCATAPLLYGTADRGAFFAKAPAIAGDEVAFGDEWRLTESEHAEYDALRSRLAGARAAQYPTISLTVRGASDGVAMALESPVSRAEVHAALPGLVADAAAELGCRSHAILHLEDDGTLREPAAELGHTRVVLGAETAMDIPVVSGQEEYFAALPRRRRYRLRAEKRQCVEQGLHTEVRTGPSSMTEDLILLQARQRAKHGMSGEVGPVREEFYRIRETVGDAVIVLSAVREGQLLGYTLCLYDKDRDELFARSAGFDYDALDGGCYFALMFHDVPAWAADHGVRRIFFGMSTYEAKRARGATLLSLYGHLRFDGPDGHLLHRATQLQSLGEARRLEALGAKVIR
ncbi:peptidogalycan biosysnthesis protein [Amycolatopsis sulphurea]|nr:peptidogalycan biosysnthesis protein [Amycolatopsis sulphurea]